MDKSIVDLSPQLAERESIYVSSSGQKCQRGQHRYREDWKKRTVRWILEIMGEHIEEAETNG